MIQIIISDPVYENDVYPLVKAFYPNDTIKVSHREVTDEENQYNQNRPDHEYNEYPAGQLLYKQQKQTVQNDSSVLSREITEDENEIVIQINFFNDRIEMFSSIDHNLRSCPLDVTLSKPQYKNAMKRFLYGILSQETGRELPWGILTGIRPTKLVYEMLEQGLEHNTIIGKMQKEYLCCESKTDMSIRIAARELELLEKMDYRNGYSLYIGIPFCPTTCLYCSFTSYSVSKYAEYVEAYLSALEKEIIYGATCFPDKKLSTVYFGGGTPTTLSAEQLDRLLGSVRKNFDFTHVLEFCVEAGRPDSITKDKLEVLKKWGVDRISINPQSMQQKTLDLIGRQHTTDMVREAFQMAREAGHQNINMDIIIGLPGEKPEDVTDTLKQVEALNPDSLTVHTLALKRAARLNINREEYAGMKASGVSEMLDETIHFAEKNAYLPYYLYRQKNMAENLENIGYARYGKEGLYNILIMEEKQTILALGAGGMSKFVFHGENRLERVDNVKSVTDYIDRIDEMISRKRLFIDENRSKL